MADALRQAQLLYQSIRFDHRNGVVRILSEPSADRSERDLIKATAEYGLTTVTKASERIKVLVVNRLNFRYSVHLPSHSPTRAPARLSDPIRVTEIKLSQLEALGRAYDALLTHAASADYVVTFALDGVTALNYLVERLKNECTDKMIFFGENHLHHVLSEFVAHYHEERPHQGLGTCRIVEPVQDRPAKGRIFCRERSVDCSRPSIERPRNGRA